MTVLIPELTQKQIKKDINQKVFRGDNEVIEKTNVSDSI